MANRKLSRSELIKTNELLKQHLKVLGTGLVEYEDGWDDEKLAKQIASDVRASSIAGVRVELFGRFIKGVNRAFDEERMKRFEASIASIESGIAATLAKVEALVLKHKKLCENLSLNRVVDVKHLA